MTGLQACFDFRVSSQIGLPELSWAPKEDTRPVVQVRLGNTPERLEGAGPGQFGLQCGGDESLLTIDDVARFLIERAETITVQPIPGVRPETVRLFLLGSVMGLVAMKRGLLLLHANAVVLGGRAHAFLGHSGAGKSTLAGQFVNAGHPLLSDDVCAVSVAEGHDPIAWPGVSRLKLWRDAADALSYPHHALAPLRDGFEKFSVAVTQPPPAPTPLTRICLLQQSELADECTLTRLSGREAMAALIEHTYRREYLPMLGLTARHFQQCAMLAQACEVYTLRRGWGLGGLERQIARIIEQFERLPA